MESVLPEGDPRSGLEKDVAGKVLCAGRGQVRGFRLEDLLERAQGPLDHESIRQRVQGKVVMVTGAAGSIGSELCRQIASFHPQALVGFDQAETPLFLLEADLGRSFPGLDFHAQIGDITRFDEVSPMMRRFHPSLVFHAAAYKHVPMMERHLFAAVENNVFGTLRVARAAVDNEVDCFVLISTDKAVRPASVMGAAKRVAELSMRSLQKENSTKFVAVRFGNVLGSGGSVVPIFEEQIAKGGPVTVTHPEMARFFMTAGEAAQLVLQASVLGAGGEVFVLDMGEPMRVVDLARRLIRLSGLEPDRDVQIEFTGIRPGEKLFEELNLQVERLTPTTHPRIRCLVSADGSNAMGIEPGLRELQSAVGARDGQRVIAILKALVPDYDPSPEILSAYPLAPGASGPR